MDDLPLLSVLDTHPRVTGALGSTQLNGHTRSIEEGSTAECASVAVLLGIIPAALVNVFADRLHMDWTSRCRRNR